MIHGHCIPAPNAGGQVARAGKPPTVGPYALYQQQDPGYCYRTNPKWRFPEVALGNIRKACRASSRSTQHPAPDYEKEAKHGSKRLTPF